MAMPSAATVGQGEISTRSTIQSSIVHMKWCRYVISALLCAINCRYLTMKIMEEGSSQTIECPGDCKIIVDDKMVMFICMMFNVHIAGGRL